MTPQLFMKVLQNGMATIQTHGVDMMFYEVKIEENKKNIKKSTVAIMSLDYVIPMDIIKTYICMFAHHKVRV